MAWRGGALLGPHAHSSGGGLTGLGIRCCARFWGYDSSDVVPDLGLQACKIDFKKLAVFLIAVENGYHKNSYHCQVGDDSAITTMTQPCHGHDSAMPRPCRIHDSCHARTTTPGSVMMIHH